MTGRESVTERESLAHVREKAHTVREPRRAYLTNRESLGARARAKERVYFTLREEGESARVREKECVQWQRVRAHV